MISVTKSGSMTLAVVVASAFVLLIALFISAAPQDLVQAASGTTVSLAPLGPVRAGEPIRLKLIVQGARNLAGFQATVSYDTEALHVLDATAVDGLRGSGRDLLHLGPVRRADAVVFGAVTCPVADCTTTKYRGALRRPQGMNGRVELGELLIEVALPGRYALALRNVQLVDPEGKVLPAATTDLLLSVK